MVVIARGAEGSILANGNGSAWVSRAAKVKVKSPIGAGDSFVAGLTLALARGDSPKESLLLGTAAACATVASDATELCSSADVDRLFPLCSVEKI